jgi:uncharacterized membrane protein
VAEVVLTLAVIEAAAYVVQSGFGGPLQAVVGAFLVLFLPGYAISTLVFPTTERGRSSPGLLPNDDRNWYVGGDTEDSPERAGLPFLERIAFGFGLSVAFVPIAAWALNVGPFDYQQVAIVTAVAGTAQVATVLGGLRRARTPSETRYAVPLGRGLIVARDALSGSRRKQAVNVALALSVVLAVGAVTVGLVAPVDGSHFTQVSVLTEGDDGELTAGNYPEELASGTTARMVLLVENYEQEPTNYTVVTQLHRVEDGNVVEFRQLNRQQSPTVDAGQSWRYDHQIAPQMTGEDLRLVYLVYRGDAPAEPREATAYRTVYIPVDVVPRG